MLLTSKDKLENSSLWKLDSTSLSLSLSLSEPATILWASQGHMEKHMWVFCSIAPDKVPANSQHQPPDVKNKFLDDSNPQPLNWTASVETKWKRNALFLLTTLQIEELWAK